MSNKGALFICILILLIITGGLATLIAFLADKMKSPAFAIGQAAVSGYNFSSENRVNATFGFAIRAHNRDPRYTIKYKVIVVSVYHNGYTLAYESLAPFVQHPRNVKVFNAGPSAKNVLVYESDVAGDLRNETKSGQLTVEVRIRAAVRFEVRGWKHRHYTLKIICSPVVIELSSGKSDHPTYCDVDRY